MRIVQTLLRLSPWSGKFTYVLSGGLCLEPASHGSFKGPGLNNPMALQGARCPRPAALSLLWGCGEAFHRLSNTKSRRSSKLIWKLIGNPFLMLEAGSLTGVLFHFHGGFGECSPRFAASLWRRFKIIAQCLLAWGWDEPLGRHQGNTVPPTGLATKGRPCVSLLCLVHDTRMPLYGLYVALLEAPSPELPT